MKNRNRIAAAVLLIILIATGCNFSHHRKRTVRVSNDNSYLIIQYCGKIRFNEDRTEIEKMSPNGYVKYRKDGKSFIAESDKRGIIHYHINNTDHYSNGNNEAKLVPRDVVQEIAMHYR